MLTLKLLGKPQVSLAGTPVVGFISSKAQALLYYLAVTGRPHTREALAGLLWGGMPEGQAAKNLRNVLSNLRALVGGFLIIARDEVSFDRSSPYSLDVEAFSEGLSGDYLKKDLSTLHGAVELYQGDFLEGFYVDDALELDEWTVAQRSLLNGRMVQALHTLVVRHLEREEHAAGIDYANRLLAIEPWREETHRHLMILLARSGQRSAALAQYEACCRLLRAGMNVEPMPETVALYRRIKASGAAPPHNLPPQPAPIVGREIELAEIAAFFHDPHAQLLTLVGPGGIGKTHLALHAAARCIAPEANVEGRFADGVFFVPLAGDDSQAEAGPQSVVNALARALRLDLKTRVYPQAQLLAYLREKGLLIILDNFDRLVFEARQLTDVLRLAPQVKLLATSRVRLNLSDERLLEVRGLTYPGDSQSSAGEALQYSAPRLFVQQARRMQAGFTLSDAETPAVIRICRLVEGVPLGIELAASWLRVLSAEEIAGEIEKSLDFLTSSMQDLPERHRSLRAVFDYSWNLMQSEEQDAFRRLSVFRGGFRREAAAQVAGIFLPVLASLVDKSLLRHSAAGRYAIHDLLRQYAEEKLEADPAEYARIRDAHCRHFAQLVSLHQAELKEEESPVSLTELDEERENVRAAWDWALSQRRVEELNLFMDCL